MALSISYPLPLVILYCHHHRFPTYLWLTVTRSQSVPSNSLHSFSFAFEPWISVSFFGISMLKGGTRPLKLWKRRIQRWGKRTVEWKSWIRCSQSLPVGRRKRSSFDHNNCSCSCCLQNSITLASFRNRTAGPLQSFRNQRLDWNLSLPFPEGTFM